MNCKNCGEKLEMTPGRRQKEFCNSTCRSNFWQKEKRKGEKGVIPMIEKHGTVNVTDLKNPTNQIKPITDAPSKSNRTIVTAPKESDYLKQRRLFKQTGKK